MSVNANDRVSSAKLKEVMDKLWDDRYLGKEPEVETVETVHTYVPNQVPASGNYADETELINAFDTDRSKTFTLPIYVYGPAWTESFNVPECNPEILATLTYEKTYTEEVSEPVTVYGSEELPNSLNDISSYTGYYMLYNTTPGFWFLTKEGNIYYYSESQPVTETVTETIKTKHTVKQDFLPNADWSVNDPDADGYVEGRTHWSEISEVNGNVFVSMIGVIGNLSIGSCDVFGPVSGFQYPNGEYKPNRVGEIFAQEDGGYRLKMTYVGEDSSGNSIIPTSMGELEEAITTTHIGVILCEEEYGSTTSRAAYIAYPNAQTGDECTVFIVDEITHKLDKKYYEYNEPYDDTAILSRLEPTVRKNLYNKPFLTRHWGYWKALLENTFDGDTFRNVTGSSSYYVQRLDMVNGDVYALAIQLNSDTQLTAIYTTYDSYLEYDPTTIITTGSIYKPTSPVGSNEPPSIEINPFPNGKSDWGFIILKSSQGQASQELQLTDDNKVKSFGDVIGELQENNYIKITDTDVNVIQIPSGYGKGRYGYVGYCVNGIMQSFVGDNDSYQTNLNNTKIYHLVYNNQVLRRVIEFKPTSFNVSGNSEATYAASRWLAGYNYTYPTELLDEIVDIRYKGVFHENLRNWDVELEWYIDSDYTLHIVNNTSKGYSQINTVFKIVYYPTTYTNTIVRNIVTPHLFSNIEF